MTQYATCKSVRLVELCRSVARIEFSRVFQILCDIFTALMAWIEAKWCVWYRTRAFRMKFILATEEVSKSITYQQMYVWSTFLTCHNTYGLICERRTRLVMKNYFVQGISRVIGTRRLYKRFKRVIDCLKEWQPQSNWQYWVVYHC